MLAFINRLKEWYRKYTRVSPIYTTQRKGKLYKEYPNLQRASVFLDCDKLKKLLRNSCIYGTLWVTEDKNNIDSVYTASVLLDVGDTKISIIKLITAHPTYMVPLLSALFRCRSSRQGSVVIIASVSRDDAHTYVSGINAALDALIQEAELTVKHHLSDLSLRTH